MIEFTQGNLLDADVDAIVNTVNTVGVMGKGIALMFKEKYPENNRAYMAYCKAGAFEPGSLFVTRQSDLLGPLWIVNFATKQHWRHPSKMEWIESGLRELREFIEDNQVRSIAVPPLGAGNGKLDWSAVRPCIERALGDLESVRVVVFEPTAKYQNVAKRTGVQALTPARAMIAELVRRYWILGFECSLLEIQKLAWLLERAIERHELDNPLDLRFEANRYGPYAHRLHHLLDGLDGSYLHCDKRLADAGPLDVIWFEEARKEYLSTYLAGPEMAPYREAFDETVALIDGFQSPLGMELLATVDWLLSREGCEPSVQGVIAALATWPGGKDAGERKRRLFDDRLIRLALDRLAS
ncbi:Appr-1-p processing protein [Marichromatium purpuratum 984]|uniref:Appr-1-p processing protein n=1 Tax=Marichromatium purpuratum 984 TaxID=765910 RepID=W0DXV2_MARPU|nr:macro domain-containing protein [Marichromatium purpuratum]AHF03445.1 Appr-1-p processing protein [Marichromatium purpuratum 984]